MFKPLSAFIGWRYFTAGSHSRLGAFISLLAVAGLTLGVSLLVVVLSIMNGFDHEMKNRILGAVPHLRISANQSRPLSDWQHIASQVERHTGVAGTSLVVEHEGMLNFRGKVQPALFKGLAPNDRFMGRFIDETTLVSLSERELLLSGLLAKQLGISPGDKLTVLVPASGSSAERAGSTAMIPSLRVFTVKGFFNTRTSLDHALVIGRFNAIANLGEVVQSPSLQVQVHDLFSVRDMGYQLLRTLPPGYSFTDWFQTHGNLYQAIKMSRNLVSLLVFLIIGIAVFNVISMLVMTVVEKRGAIAILKTLGASRGAIVRIFLLKGACIGIFGALAGALLGAVLALNVTDIASWLETALGVRFINAEVYPVDYLPSVLAWRDVALIVVTALCLNFLATIYPAWKAASTHPAEVLRAE